jgi:hypothetical protein
MSEKVFSNRRRAGSPHKSTHTGLPALTVRVPFQPEVGAALIAYAAETNAPPHVVVAEIVRVHLGLAGATS